MQTEQTAEEKFAERERARIEFEKARAERNRREAAELEFRRGCED